MTETETLAAPQQQRATLDLVFVDPDDSSISWWWPALALNRDDLPAFRAQTQGQVEEPAIDQVMVCYLEDGSFSNVSPKDLQPFTLTESPYIDYAKARFSKSFSKDPAIKTAVKYLEAGELPEEFTWLLRAREKRLAAITGETALGDTGMSVDSPETVQAEPAAPPPKKKAKAASSAKRDTPDPQVAPAAEPDVSTKLTLNESVTNGRKGVVKPFETILKDDASKSNDKATSRPIHPLHKKRMWSEMQQKNENAATPPSS